MKLLVDGNSKEPSVAEIDRALDLLARNKLHLIRIERAAHTYIQVARASNLSFHLDFQEDMNSQLMACKAPVEFTKTRALLHSYLEGTNEWVSLAHWVPFSSTDRVSDGGAQYSMLPSKPSYRQRMALLVTTLAVTLVFINYTDKGPLKEKIITDLIVLFFMVTLVLPGVWTLRRPFHISVIANAITALNKQEPFDRDEFERACRFFRQNPDIRRLGELPPDAPIPADLLARVTQSLPQMASQSISGLGFVFAISAFVIILLGIVRLLAAILRLLGH